MLERFEALARDSRIKTSQMQRSAEHISRQDTLENYRKLKR
jgi:hypothetical protein